MYKYGMRLRCFSIACQPMMFLDHVEDDPSGKYWNILFYKEPLPDGDVKAYDLDYLGETK